MVGIGVGEADPLAADALGEVVGEEGDAVVAARRGQINGVVPQLHAASLAVGGGNGVGELDHLARVDVD